MGASIHRSLSCLGLSRPSLTHRPCILPRAFLHYTNPTWIQVSDGVAFQASNTPRICSMKHPGFNLQFTICVIGHPFLFSGSGMKEKLLAVTMIPQPEPKGPCASSYYFSRYPRRPPSEDYRSNGRLPTMVTGIHWKRPLGPLHHKIAQGTFIMDSE